MTIRPIHNDTILISEMLRECPIGEIITLDAISRRIGRDIRTCRHLLVTSLKTVEIEQGALFATLRGVGYRRSPSDHTHQVGKTARARIRGYARRGQRKITNALSKANDISQPALREALREQSVLGLMEYTSKEVYQPKVPESSTRQLSVADVAVAFFQKMGIGPA